MEKLQLIHNCFTFQHNKHKFVYGITSSMLMSNFLIKFKPNFIILPSQAYVNGVFMLAGVGPVLRKLETKSEKTGKEENAMLQKVMKYCKVLVADEKGLGTYFPESSIGSLIQNSLLYTLKDHQIEQKAMMKAHLTEIINQLSPPIQQNLSLEPLDWINCPLYELKIKVPQAGMTTYLCQGTDIIVVDPTDEFVNYLKYNYILKGVNHHSNDKLKAPKLLTLLKTVVITKMMSVLAALSLMLVSDVGKITVIVVSSELETALIQKSRKYLKLPQEIVRSRFLIRNIGVPFNQRPHRFPIIFKHSNPFNLQAHSTLLISFYPLSEKSQPYLEFSYGSSIDIKSNKKIIFHTPSTLFSTELEPEAELTHFPQLIEDNYVEFVILYNVNEELMKELKALPQPLRKKIILNRNEHKYNHKYFITLEKNKIEYCMITDTQYLQLVAVNKKKKNEVKSLGDILENFKNKQIIQKSVEKSTNGLLMTLRGIQAGARVYEMGLNAQIETVNQVVQILDGILMIQFQEDKRVIIVCGDGQEEPFQRVKRIKALKYALVKIMIESDYKISMNFLSKQNSFSTQMSNPQNFKPLAVTSITALSSLFGIEHLSTVEDNSLLKSLNLTQQRELNKICHPITYEVGFKTNNHNQSLYFISKGGMKWEDHDEVAGNGCFIGDLASYYGLKEGTLHQFQNYIQVVKDTWALEINIEEFHQFVLLHHPHLLYEIYCKGKIFH